MVIANPHAAGARVIETNIIVESALHNSQDLIFQQFSAVEPTFCLQMTFAVCGDRDLSETSNWRQVENHTSRNPCSLELRLRNTPSDTKSNK